MAHRSGLTRCALGHRPRILIEYDGSFPPVIHSIPVSPHAPQRLAEHGTTVYEAHLP